MNRPVLPTLLLLALFAWAPGTRAATEEPLELAGRVAAWQMQTPADAAGLKKYPHGFNQTSWRVGTFYTAVGKLFQATGDERWGDAVLAWARKNQWKPGARETHADDQSVMLAYIDLHGQRQDPEELAPTIAEADATLEAAKTGRWIWHWADALYMAAPAYAALGRVTGDARYLDFLDSHFMRSVGTLYNPEERLFYRDKRYFDLRDEDGVQVFWGRGNGWAFAALASVLDELPADHATRGDYEEVYLQVADRLLGLQQPDGFWKASLLNPERFPNGESSATAFFCYGLGWGVNQGLLDRDRYGPAVEDAWAALAGAVNDEGRLGFVQPGGDNPYNPRADQHEFYGSAAFILAAIEVSELRAAEPTQAADD